MNTDVRIITIDWQQSALLAEAERAFHDIESRFSRFLPQSELSRLNAQSGERVIVSPRMLQLIDLAVFFHHRTGGLFDPAVLPLLEDGGYDRSFELVARDGAACATGRARDNATIADLELDREHFVVTAPRGVRLDFGGIGKGYAVDVAAQRLQEAHDFLIDAGGDIFASGDGPEGDGWLIGIADPSGGDDIDVVTLRDQAIATSTTSARRWKRGGRWLNHIIDPRDGSPTRSEIISASVIASTATEADVYAKCALILGPGEGRRFLESQRVRGLFVLEDGTTIRTPGWPAASSSPVERSSVCIAD